MTGEHCSDDDLFACADPLDPEVDLTATKKHVAECAECRTRLDEILEFNSILRSPLVWDALGNLDAVEGGTMPQLPAADIEMEQRQADELLRPFLARLDTKTAESLPENAALHTPSVVQRLCDVARTHREKNPLLALTVAEAAIAIAEHVAAKQQFSAEAVHESRGRAWLERANALRYVGRFPEALAALDTAEASYSQTFIPEYPLALAAYVRSVIFMKSEKLEEALSLARSCAATFLEFGEDERFVHARIVEGGALFLQNRHAEARDVFQSLLAPARKLQSPDTVARVYANLASALIELGELSEASSYLANAASLFEDLGLDTERLRMRWTMGHLLLRSGDTDAALARLRDTKRDAERLHLTNDAALIALDMLEALTARGDWHEAMQLCEGLVQKFSAAGMNESALVALSYLRDLARSGALVLPAIEHVRSHLERLATEPARLFLQPPA